MKKKTAIISLIVVLLVGSFITFYAGNLFSSDISNMFQDSYIITTFPMLTVSFYFVLAVLFLIRFYRYPQYKKAIINLYSLITIGIAIVGLITSLISGFGVYKSFIKPYPFKLYLILMLLIHVLMISLMVLINLKNRKTEDDIEKKKIKVKYAIYSCILPVLIFMAMYRFGGVLWMPFYAQARTLYLTIYFYIWICLPMALLAHIIFYFLDIYKNAKQSIIYLEILLVLHVVLGIVVMVIGSNNTIFISAISPALPLERLATAPLDTIIEMVAMLILLVYYVTYSIISQAREEKKIKEATQN